MHGPSLFVATSHQRRSGKDPPDERDGSLVDGYHVTATTGPGQALGDTLENMFAFVADPDDALGGCRSHQFDELLTA